MAHAAALMEDYIGMPTRCRNIARIFMVDGGLDASFVATRHRNLGASDAVGASLLAAENSSGRT
jgi:hypothetical protein